MLSPYILLYQYFENQELKLEQQILTIQDRVLYSKERNLSVDDINTIYRLKIKLDYVRKIGSELLKMFQSMI